jgi:hypothetical protein
MIIQRIIALTALVLAFALLAISQVLSGKMRPILRKYLRYSGLVYLSVTVLLYVLVRFRPDLPVEYVALAEGLALLIHLFTCGLLTFVERKLSRIQENSDKKSDVEPK